MHILAKTTAQTQRSSRTHAHKSWQSNIAHEAFLFFQHKNKEQRSREEEATQRVSKQLVEARALQAELRSASVVHTEVRRSIQMAPLPVAGWGPLRPCSATSPALLVPKEPTI